MVPRLLEFKALADEAMNFAFVCEKAVSSAAAAAATGSSTSPVASTSELPVKLPDQDFVYALRVTDAFAVGFKTRRNKPAEMIAKYLDKAMRKGQGSTSDAEFQALLDSALALYRFTDDKDVFRTFYHRSLAKRLLLEKTASDDFEVAMLKKLKLGSLFLAYFLYCWFFLSKFQIMIPSLEWGKICSRIWRFRGRQCGNIIPNCQRMMLDSF